MSPILSSPQLSPTQRAVRPSLRSGSDGSQQTHSLTNLAAWIERKRVKVLRND